VLNQLICAKNRRGTLGKTPRLRRAGKGNSNKETVPSEAAELTAPQTNRVTRTPGATHGPGAHGGKIRSGLKGGHYWAFEAWGCLLSEKDDLTTWVTNEGGRHSGPHP